MCPKCASELAEVRSWADERIAAQTEQMELQSEEAKVVAARSKEETKVEVAQLMEVWRTFFSLESGEGDACRERGRVALEYRW